MDYKSFGAWPAPPGTGPGGANHWRALACSDVLWRWNPSARRRHGNSRVRRHPEAQCHGSAVSWLTRSCSRPMRASLRATASQHRPVTGTVTGPLFDDAIGPLMSGLTAWSGAPVPGSLISMEGNMSTMDDSRLTALHRGEVETRNLAECLALDQSALLKTVLPDIGMAQTADSVIAVADR